jgi:hypothetical protein
VSGVSEALLGCAQGPGNMCMALLRVVSQNQGQENQGSCM